jgi:hypothetical protein
VRSFRLVAPLLLLLSTSAQAHLMVAQHGTLNLVGEGAFLVLSLPATAFPFADDDGDGRLGLSELRAHLPQLTAAVQAGVLLRDEEGLRPLEGVLLSLAPSDEAPAAPSVQLVVLGRFALERPSRALRLQVALEAGALEVTVTRGTERQVLLLGPGHHAAAVLPSAWATFTEAAQLGAEHILGGADHLLFLLVVLAAGGGARHLLAALTCFTLGHAITLALSVGGGLCAPNALVEPAIAVTIVGMAALDWSASARGRPLPRGLRLALVFGCALIHGLGLSSALRALGVDRAALLPLVAGFNLGVELGQVAVCAAAVAAVALLLRARGSGALEGATRLARLASIAAGAAWFVQRVLA